jgi:hypothetical protein
MRQLEHMRSLPCMNTKQDDDALTECTIDYNETLLLIHRIGLEQVLMLVADITGDYVEDWNNADAVNLSEKKKESFDKLAGRIRKAVRKFNKDY